MPKKGFRFDAELDQMLFDILDNFLEPAALRHSLESFAFLDEVTTGRHQAMTAFMLGYIFSTFTTYYELVKEREPNRKESEALIAWMSEVAAPMIEDSMTEYEKKRELK
jgi:hypothetical protein